MTFFISQYNQRFWGFARLIKNTVLEQNTFLSRVPFILDIEIIHVTRLPPVHVECTNNILIAQRLTLYFFLDKRTLLVFFLISLFVSHPFSPDYVLPLPYPFYSFHGHNHPLHSTRSVARLQYQTSFYLTFFYVTIT